MSIRMFLLCWTTSARAWYKYSRLRSSLVRTQEHYWSASPNALSALMFGA